MQRGEDISLTLDAFFNVAFVTHVLKLVLAWADLKNTSCMCLTCLTHP
jgi:hypothetical protein